MRIETRTIDLRLYLEFDTSSHNGKYRALLVTIDITEVKKNERELQRWADVFRHSQWGIAVGSAGKTDLEMLNPAFAEMHGYTVEELKGKPVEMLFAPEERPKLPTFIKNAYEKGSISFETKHLRKDGSRFPILVNVTATKDSDGNLEDRIVNIQDITELKEAEAIIARERDRGTEIFRYCRCNVRSFEY